MYRIGVIADTHVPEFLPALPAGIAQVFQGVDLILHAGDVTGAEVLTQLRSMAPLVAIKGDHDQLDLPLKTIVEIGGIRIGMLHGRRPRWQEAPSVLSNMLFTHRSSWGGFQKHALRAFEDVDVIVFGHFHRPYQAWHNGTLLFSPGAVYHLTPELARTQLAYTLSPARRLYLRRMLHRAPGVPSVGLLTVDNGKISAQVLPLPAET